MWISHRVHFECNNSLIDNCKRILNTKNKHCVKHPIPISSFKLTEVITDGHCIVLSTLI